jgi:hypothetical protein
MKQVTQVEFNVVDNKERMLGVCVVTEYCECVSGKSFKAFVRNTKDGKPFGSNYSTGYFSSEAERTEWVNNQVSKRQAASK